VNTVNENIITNELINNFKIYLYEEERSENTIEKYMRDIRFFREWLQDRCVDKSVVIEYKKELFGLRFQQATGQLENTARIRQVRKTIARIKTVIRERELNQ